MSIRDLMAAAAQAQAAQAAQAAAVSGAATTQTAVAAAAAAGGAGEGATQTTQAAAAGAGVAGDEGAAAAASADAAAAVQVATPDLSALVTKVTELSVANAKLQTERDSYLASCAAMITVVSDSLDRMSISLGGGKIDVAAMTPESLVAQHATTAATFSAKFPVGGVAAVPVNAESNQEAQARDAESLALHNMRVAAAAGGTAAKK